MSRCKVCFKEIEKNSINSLRKDICICQKCFSRFEPKFYENKIGKYKLEVIYDYDEVIKEYLYKLKGCYDYELAPIFLNRFIIDLKIKYRNYVIVPVPSNEEDDLKRGFNHVIEIFKNMNLEYKKIIKKNIKFKQSDLSKIDREKVDEKLKIIDLNSIRDKKVLLVDDVLTTGSTIRACIKLIEQANPKSINILLLARKPSIKDDKIIAKKFINLFKK